MTLHARLLPVMAAFVMASVAMAAALAPAPAHAQDRVIERIEVRAPDHAPDGEMWDTAIGGILAGRLRGILPDLRICIASAHVPETCSPVCQDSKTCEAHPGVLLEPGAVVQVVDVDPRGVQLVGRVRLPDPSQCRPCSFDTPGGPLEIHVDVAEVAAYAGPYRGSVGRPAPQPPARAPGRAPPPAVAADVETALADLRDHDNCVGSDRVFPAGTLLLRQRALLDGPQFRRYYQLGAFAGAIDDARARQAVLTHIRTKLRDDYDDLFVPLIWSDVQHSRQLTDAFVDASTFVAELAMSRGLDRLIPAAATRPGEFLRDKMVDDVSQGLAQRAIDAIFDFGISAECAMNELAKQSLIRAAAR